MPISYAMNSCAITWIPAEYKEAGPPLRQAQLTRSADTLVICETTWGENSMHAGWMWNLEGFAHGGTCTGVFTHPAGKVGNFIFFDGHVKSKKWLSTLYPMNENNWELDPNPDPRNRFMNGSTGCKIQVPAGPDAKEFQTPGCLAYR